MHHVQHSVGRARRQKGARLRCVRVLREFVLGFAGVCMVFARAITAAFSASGVQRERADRECPPEELPHATRAAALPANAQRARPVRHGACRRRRQRGLAAAALARALEAPAAGEDGAAGDQGLAQRSQVVRDAQLGACSDSVSGVRGLFQVSAC